MLNKKYHITVIGCQMNKSDSERVAGLLEVCGFSAADRPEDASLIIFTTCGVRQSAEDRVYGLVPQYKRANKDSQVIVTGCLSQREDVRQRLGKWVDLWLPISDLPRLPELLGLSDIKSLKDYLNIVPKYDSNRSAYVPIGNGCNNFCAYCVVPYARGREVYRPADEIVAEASELAQRGFKEIVLIAQNVNSYRSIHNERETSFADLLRSINSIPGKFWIRFSTSHPKDMSDELIAAIAECDKVCEHVHLPAQAGDDDVLAAMNRKYKIEHYKDLIKKIRGAVNRKKELPVAITTDIIVGFPSETPAQFQNTRRLFEETSYDMAYISQYSIRPGTAASKLTDDVSVDDKKKREEDLEAVLHQSGLANNEWYRDKVVDVLVDERRTSGEYFGKTRTSKTVRFKSDRDDLLGEFVRVRIKEVNDFGLSGVLMDK